MKTIAVIDYGMGNLRSVAKAVEHVAAADVRGFWIQIDADVLNPSVCPRWTRRSQEVRCRVSLWVCWRRSSVIRWPLVCR